MQLSPLQSRLAASVVASCVLFAIYLFLFSPPFAFAAELDEITLVRDAEALAVANGPPLRLREGDLEMARSGPPMYEPEFTPFDRSVIGRATDGVKALDNNAPENTDVDAGSMVTYLYKASSVSARENEVDGATPELRRRGDGSPEPLDEGTGNLGTAERAADGDENDVDLGRRQAITRTLWISANTCIQPERKPDQTTMDPPQLTLYVSTSKDNTEPGPMADKGKQDVTVFTEGAAMYNTSLDRDVYFSIVAPPNVSSDGFTSRRYNVNVAASIDKSYYSFDDTSDPDLVWVDSDAAASLLSTRDMMRNDKDEHPVPPYSLFAYTEDYIGIKGIRNSYCGLKEYAMIGGSRSALPQNMSSTGMSTRGTNGSMMRQEFFLGGLNASTRYQSILARDPNSITKGKRTNAPGGGGIVFRQTDFATKPAGACYIVFNLTFCDNTQYAVPGNPKRFANTTALASFYDDYAKEMYDNFDKALQQVACEAPSTERYSLARNCEDCREAYKNWVCSVAIPRCEDFSNDAKYLQARNIGQPFPNGTVVDPQWTKDFGSRKAYNSSRSSRINEEIQPGPYKEVLPCDDLCFDIVQSCPAQLKFACPTPDMLNFNTSYGHRRKAGDNVTCNYPGSAHYRSASSTVLISWFMVHCTLGGMLTWLLLG